MRSHPILVTMGCGVVMALAWWRLLPPAATLFAPESYHAFEPDADEPAGPSLVGVDLPRSGAELQSRIEAGDLSLLPVLWRWFDEWLENDPSAHPSGGVLAIRGIGAFGDRSALPLFIDLWRDKELPEDSRRTLMHAIVMIAGKSEQALLREIVQHPPSDLEKRGPRGWDLLLPARCEAAGKLVRFDDDVGREFLLEQFELLVHHRKTPERSWAPCARDELDRLYDEKLVAALEQTRANETDRFWQRYFDALLNRMRLNKQMQEASLEQLKQWALDTSEENAERRRRAIEVLGERAPVELISFLETLKPWPHIKVEEGAVDQFQELTSRAIGRIKCREFAASSLAHGVPVRKRPDRSKAKLPRWQEVTDPAEKTPLADEAWAEYQKIKALLMKGRFQAFVRRAMDNGDPNEALELLSLPEAEGDLKRSQQLVQSVDKLDPKPVNLRIERDTNAARKGTETVIARFQLEGTAELGREVAKKHGRATVAPDDTLLVIMTRIDGKWYWNPFGW